MNAKARDYLWEYTKGITGIGSQSQTESQQKLCQHLQVIMGTNLPTRAIMELCDIIDTAYKIGKEL